MDELMILSGGPDWATPWKVEARLNWAPLSSVVAFPCLLFDQILSIFSMTGFVTVIFNHLHLFKEEMTNFVGKIGLKTSVWISTFEPYANENGVSLAPLCMVG